MDIEEQRQNIIASVFARRSASGSDENYVAHIKIWEDAGPEGGGRKPRYILLSQASNGTGYMHKSKLNTNGTYSVGKTWRIQELRGIQVSNPTSFNITLSRTYRWDTENREQQGQFLQALVQVFRYATRGAAPLHLEGYLVRDPNIQLTIKPDGVPSQRAGPSSSIPNAPSSSRVPFSAQSSVYDDSRRNPSPGPYQSQRAPIAGVSPPNNRERTSSTLPPPAGLAAASRPQARRPSNAASTVSQVPSVNSQTAQSRPLPLANSVSRDSQHSRDPREASIASDYPSRSRNASPAPSGRSKVPPPRNEPSPAPSARSRAPPTRTETYPPENTVPNRRDQNVRISYFDPSNQALLDRLLTNATDSTIDIDGEEESTRATLTNVEEMIEGYEWASDEVIGRRSTRGAIDMIEARLLDELTALEKANVHSFLESDDRIGVVMKYLDEAVAELDSMDGLISSYKIHLNAVSDDIMFIQSQNRGLQVQTQNQRALLGEIQNLLRTVHRLEEAAAELYKALQAGRDTDMAATMERLQDYKTHNSQFCKRMFDFLSIMFTAQSKLLLAGTNGITKTAQSYPLVAQHQTIEAYLGRYAGLMLYLKEMDESIYGRLCAAYFSSMSELHQTQITALLGEYLSLVKKGQEDDQESGFGGATAPVSKAGAGMRRAGTLIRSPLEGRGKDRDKNVSGDQRASEVFDLVLDQIQTSIYRESDFITDFLQINDAGLTFADYMGLDSYFRRQAARSAGLSQTTVKLIRGAMDLIFGFLPADLKVWLDSAIAKDKLEIIGIIGTIERAIENAEQKNNPFFVNLLDKQHTRLKSMFDRHIAEQLKQIETTKLTSKKRRGVAPFIKYFSSYVNNVENQLVGAEGLEVRSLADAAYERIVKGMFESLRQMAKLEGEGEDKGQLNYHVILIDDEDGACLYERVRAERADFFDAVERLGPDSANLSTGSTYNKSALRKTLKEFNAKDMRKHIEGLYKRVEKHFTDASDKSAVDDLVLNNVWKACEAELLKFTDKITSLISKYYGDSGVAMEFSKSDIESAFKKTRAGL
ncbi:exocyst protein [Ephemerocybe angulata]|uniref:Exocyst protein n=1 Tax=Ephemerocybe angulata TaxID=980116 RepID=A0A8H6IJ83_9AGAR|nr:exocyst protein [Tulosesus angulatus]